MTITQEELAELEKLLVKAAPGPWSLRDETCAGCRDEGGEWTISEVQGGHHDMFGSEHDGRLIVAAINALPRLIAAARAASAKAEGLTA